MIIKKPITATIDPNNRYTTNLHYPGGGRLKFYMRGAISWPRANDEGFAIMAGQDLRDNIIIIFEQFRFWMVDHWLNPDKTIRKRHDGGYHLGLIQFLQECEACYKCSSYFYGGQHVDLIKRHVNDVYRNPMLPRRVELIEVPFVSEVGDDLMLEKSETRQIKAQKDSFLDKSFSQWFNSRKVGIGDNNQVNALRILLTGFDFQPWVNLKK